MFTAAYLAIAGTAGAQDFRLDSAGIRAGIPGNESSGDFHQVEAFVDWNLPWRWKPGSDWLLQPRLDASGGWLGESGFSAAIFSAGPLLALGHERFPVGLETGISPTGLTRSRFETKDFGTRAQFTTHVGLYWDALPCLRVAYRFQHMSNAGLDTRNPGLNLHVFGLSYRF